MNIMVYKNKSINKLLDDHKLSFEDNNSSKINYSLDDNDDIIGIPAFLAIKTMKSFMRIPIMMKKF